jgi:hypothetical protein
MNSDLALYGTVLFFTLLAGIGVMVMTAIEEERAVVRCLENQTSGLDLRVERHISRSTLH